MLKWNKGFPSWDWVISHYIQTTLYLYGCLPFICHGIWGLSIYLLLRIRRSWWEMFTIHLSWHLGFIYLFTIKDKAVMMRIYKYFLKILPSVPPSGESILTFWGTITLLSTDVTYPQECFWLTKLPIPEFCPVCCPLNLPSCTCALSPSAQQTKPWKTAGNGIFMSIVTFSRPLRYNLSNSS